MLSPQIKECRNCNSLKELRKLVECSLLNLSRNKLNNENYNVETFYSSEQATALAHYKRILTRKLYNSTYLTDIENQDIVFQVNKILFGKCPVCIDCDIPVEDTTTTTVTGTSTFIGSTTSSTTTTMPTTTTTTTTNLFIDPPGIPIACGEEVAFDGGETFPSAFEIILGSGLGTVTLTTEAFNIPDKMIVIFDDEIVINTGYRGDTSYQEDLDEALIDLGQPTETITAPGSDVFNFNKTTTTTSAFVYVFAPLPDTQWNFTLSCPV